MSLGQNQLRLNGEVHQKELNGQGLQIGSSGLDPTRHERRGDDGNRRLRRDGWGRQEHLVQRSTEQGEERQSNWKKFNGDPRQPGVELQGSVAIDQPAPRFAMKPEAQPTKEWAQGAAEFEEWGRAHADRIGAHEPLELPRGDTSPDARRAPKFGRTQRRPFTVG
ncbi:MAG: hypothetical protein IPG45_15715 [Deltaproteobacteria bacterium]|nr:hypothetical protein [Deltaproteobacteria bacterium]